MNTIFNIRIIFFITLCSGIVNAKTLEVCNSCPFKSIKKAIHYSINFDTVLVKKGTYDEYNIEISKSLTLIGDNLPIIDGGFRGKIIQIKSDDVNVIGFKIINVKKSYLIDNASIRVTRSKNFNILNNILEEPFFGIYIENSSNGIIRNNKIFGNEKEEYDSGNGIQLWSSNNIVIENNFITKVRDGIYLEFSDKCKIIENTSTKNIRYGLHFMFSNNDSYEKNNFIDNRAGVAVMFSENVNMHGNTFKENWGSASYGLLLKEINDSEITHNVFSKNTTAINVEGSNRLKLQYNNFVNNGWAIKIRGACYSNKFIENNFVFNSFDLAYNSDINDNSFDNNYWSSYHGYDLDNDGYGDVPHRPVKLFTYIVNIVPETTVLLRSLFIDLINFSEKISPVFTPKKLLDNSPLMKMVI